MKKALIILGLALFSIAGFAQEEHLGGPHIVTVVARHADGTVFYRYTGHNLRTNAGANWQADLMSSTTTPAVNTQCNYVALSNDATAPAATDTTLTSEITLNGLGRAQATYTHSANASSYTLTYTWTASGTQAAQKFGVFTAATSGTMCFENTIAPVTLNSSDTLSFTETVNF